MASSEADIKILRSELDSADQIQKDQPKVFQGGQSFEMLDSVIYIKKVLVFYGVSSWKFV